MWDFAYQAKNNQGELLSGSLSAEDVSAAVQALAGQGLEVVSIRRMDVVNEPSDTEQSAVETPAHDSARALLSEVIERRHVWLPVIESQLQELPPGPAQRAVERRVQRLSQTMTIEQFLQNADAVNLLPLLSSHERPAPTSHGMQAWLHRIYQHQQRRLRLGSRWSYPLLLAAIALALVGGWGAFILPIFREMFDEFGLRLPAPTRLVFSRRYFQRSWLGM